MSHQTSCSTMMFTDLVICDEGNAMINSHSANGKIILHVASVVIGQVDHQVYMTFTDQSSNTNTECKYDSLTFKNPPVKI